MVEISYLFKFYGYVYAWASHSIHQWMQIKLHLWLYEINCNFRLMPHYSQVNESNEYIWYDMHETDEKSTSINEWRQLVANTLVSHSIKNADDHM